MEAVEYDYSREYMLHALYTFIYIFIRILVVNVGQQPVLVQT